MTWHGDGHYYARACQGAVMIELLIFVWTVLFFLLGFVLGYSSKGQQ